MAWPSNNNDRSLHGILIDESKYGWGDMSAVDL